MTYEQRSSTPSPQEPELPFDFDCLIDRTETESLKWGYYDAEAVLPMWVADMDFPSPPAIIRALHERVDHGVFGYERHPPALSELIVERLAQLYDWRVSPEAITYLPGVVPGFNVATRAFVRPNEALVVQTPVYMHILHAAHDAGVQGQAMALTEEHDGSYSVDVDRFAATITGDTRMFILCNPHNPVGRVFRRDELAAMAEVCLRNDVLICSDEIHGDLIFNGHRHVPIAALAPEVADRTITLMAPSKTFNIAGLHCAFAIITNPDLRRRYNAGRGGLVGTPNLLGYTAAEAAYRDGQPWLDATIHYLEANRDLVVRTVNEEMPGLRVTAPEGTYLAWIDCRDAGLPTSPQTFFLERGRVAFNDGAAFGPGGEGFVRFNFGCPCALVTEGLARMKKALTGLG